LAIATERITSTQASSASAVGSTVDRAARLRLLDDVGDVLGLVVEHGGHVHGQAVLADADVEPVREVAAGMAVQGAEAVLVVVVERQAVPAGDLEPDPPPERRRDLEARGVDDAVDRVLDPVRHHARLVIRSTPLAALTSTEVTFGRLKGAGTRR
jgi:hypothetical protein